MRPPLGVLENDRISFNPVTQMWERAPGGDTIHFTIGNLGAPTLAPPGVPTAAAMSFFGQLNISRAQVIQFAHLHLIEGGNIGAVLEVEIYRRRAGVFTRIAVISHVGDGSNFTTDFSVPSDGVAELQIGDYLFCQPTTNSAALGSVDGMTVDIHFVPGSGPN